MRYSRGFTLTEVLVTAVISAVTISVAIPSYSALIKTLEARNVAYSLQELVHFGRNYALRSHSALTICGSTDTFHCDGNWSRGALVMEDGNRNGVMDGNDRILQFVTFNLKQATLTWNGFSGSRVVIESFGTTFASNGTFTYCRQDSDPLYRRQVVINRGGRARLSRDINGDGIHENSQGVPIVCP